MAPLKGHKLIIVGPSPPPAHGVAVMTLAVIEALRSTGWHIQHLDTRDPRPVEHIGKLDLRNVWLALLHLTRFVKLLASTPGAAVYVPISQGRLGFARDALFLLAARFARRRRYVHLHGGYFATFSQSADPATRWLIRVSLRGTTQAWVLTESLRGQFAGSLELGRVRVLENAVADVMAHHVGPATARSDKTPLRLLYLSNLVPEKGCVDLLEALQGLGPMVTGMELRLVGEVPRGSRGDIAQRVRALEAVGLQVEVAGVLRGAERDDAYVAADVFVYPTRYRYEGQPLVLLEAMSAGLAVVTTWHAGIPDTLREGLDGLLVAPGDTFALGEALLQLREDPELRRRLGEAARRRYEQRYRLERFDREIISLLCEDEMLS